MVAVVEVNLIIAHCGITSNELCEHAVLIHRTGVDIGIIVGVIIDQSQVPGGRDSEATGINAAREGCVKHCVDIRLIHHIIGHHIEVAGVLLILVGVNALWQEGNGVGAPVHAEGQVAALGEIVRNRNAARASGVGHRHAVRTHRGSRLDVTVHLDVDAC